MTSPFILLNPRDNVAVAGPETPAGTCFETIGVTLVEDVHAGHKFAVKAIARNEPIRKYNQVIGFATADIPVGAHVHVHNLGMGEEFSRDHTFCVEARKQDVLPEGEQAQFMGIVRPDGQVATRNYIGILTPFLP